MYFRDGQIGREINFIAGCRGQTQIHNATLMLVYQDLYTEISGQNGKELQAVGKPNLVESTGCIKKTQPRNFLRNHFAILKHKRF